MLLFTHKLLIQALIMIKSHHRSLHIGDPKGQRFSRRLTSLRGMALPHERTSSRF